MPSSVEIGLAPRQHMHFVDLATNDAVKGSNTYLAEQCLGWHQRTRAIADFGGAREI